MELLQWWYTTGWMQAVHRVGEWTVSVSRAFSADILLRTLFAPWRRIISLPGGSIDSRIHAAFDNFVSRCIGCVVRLCTLFIAVVSMVTVLCVGIVMVLAWPFIPLAALYCGVRGIVG